MGLLDKLGQLVIEITADTEDAERGMQKTMSQAQQMSDELSRSYKEVGNRFSEIGVGFTSIGRLASRLGTTISMNLTTPLLGAGVSAAKTALEFQALKERVGIGFEVLLGSAEKAKTFMDDLYAYSKTTPFSQETFYEAAQTLLAMGFSAEQAKTNLDAFTNASIATGAGAAGIDTMTRAFGKMNASGKVTLESLNILTDMGIPAVKVLANQLGMTTEEFFAATRAGEVLAEDALPKLVEGLQNGTDGFAGVTAAYGDLAGKMKEGTLQGALDSLHSAWRNFSVGLFDSEENFPKVKELIRAVTELVKNLGPVFQAVTDAAGPALDDLIEKIKEFTEYIKNASPEELKEIGDTIIKIASAGPALLGIGVAFKTVGAAYRAYAGIFKILGDNSSGLGKALAGVSMKASDLKQKIVGMGPAYKAHIPLNEKLAGGFNKIKTGAAGLITKVAGVGPAIAGVVSGGPMAALQRLGQGVLGFLGKAPIGLTRLIGVFNPIGVIVLAVITAIAAVMAAVKKHADEIKNVITSFAEKIDLKGKLEKLEAAWKSLYESLIGSDSKGFMEDLKGILEKVGEAILIVLVPAFGVIAGVVSGFITLITGLITAIQGVVEIFQGVFEVVAGIVTGDGERIVQGFETMGGGITKVFGGLWDGIKGFVTDFVDGVIGFFTSLWDELVGHSIVPDTIRDITKWFGDLPGLIFGGLADFVTGVIKKFVEMGDDVVDEVSKLPGKVAEWFTKIGSSVGTAVSGLASQAWTWGRHLVDGLIGGIRSMFSAAQNAARSLASSVASFLHFTRPDEGPLRDYETWMPDFVDGLTTTLNRAKPQLIKAVAGLSRDIGDTMSLGEIRTAQSVSHSVTFSEANNSNYKLDRIIAMMQQFFPRLEGGLNQQLVLDTGLLVGATAPRMNEELGRLALRKKRGV